MSETSPDRLPPLPPPRDDLSPRNRRLQSALMFLAKAIVFTIVFWTVWLNILRPFFEGEPENRPPSAETVNEQLRARYEEQALKADAMLKRQAELLDRWQKVIERWEATAPPGK
jgi:hypothetical protein